VSPDLWSSISGEEVLQTGVADLGHAESRADLYFALAMVAKYGMNTARGHIIAFPVDVEGETYILVSISLAASLLRVAGLERWKEMQDALRSEPGPTPSDSIHKRLTRFFPQPTTGTDTWLYIPLATLTNAVNCNLEIPQLVIRDLPGTNSATPSGFRKMSRLAWGVPVPYEQLATPAVRAYVRHVSGVFDHISHFDGLVLTPTPLFTRETIADAMGQGEDNKLTLFLETKLRAECPFLILS
jgi:hypothetical protein